MLRGISKYCSKRYFKFCSKEKQKLIENRNKEHCNQTSNECYEFKKGKSKNTSRFHCMPPWKEKGVEFKVPIKGHLRLLD